MYVCLYNQALADVRSTGASIECRYYIEPGNSSLNLSSVEEVKQTSTPPHIYTGRGNRPTRKQWRFGGDMQEIQEKTYNNIQDIGLLAAAILVYKLLV